MKKFYGPVKLRDTPATDLELHRIRRARETGKVKNPTWYSAPRMPEGFKPQLGQKYPGYVKAMFANPQAPAEPKFPSVERVYSEDDGDFERKAAVDEYIKAFEKANKLRHIPFGFGRVPPRSRKPKKAA